MPPPPQTKAIIVGENEIYKRENPVGLFLVLKLLGPPPPPNTEALCQPPPPPRFKDALVGVQVCRPLRWLWPPAPPAALPTLSACSHTRPLPECSSMRRERASRLLQTALANGAPRASVAWPSMHQCRGLGVCLGHSQGLYSQKVGVMGVSLWGTRI